MFLDHLKLPAPGDVYTPEQLVDVLSLTTGLDWNRYSESEVGLIHEFVMEQAGRFIDCMLSYTDRLGKVHNLPIQLYPKLTGRGINIVCDVKIFRPNKRKATYRLFFNRCGAFICRGTHIDINYDKQDNVNIPELIKVIAFGKSSNPVFL